MMASIRSMSTAAALATVLLACGGGGGDGGGGITPPPGGGGGGGGASPNTVVLGGSSFNPSTLTIQRNGLVTWNNTSGVTHNVTFITTGSPPNIPDHSSGTNDRTFNTVGTFNYNCTRHGGMSGAITVQ